MAQDPNTDFPALAPDTRDLWEQNAPWWDAHVGEDGTAWHRLLIAPATERLLAIEPGERILDVACGNGQFARRLAQLGAHVVACDFSATFLDRARHRTTLLADLITYRLLDVTNEEHLATLGTAEFDAAVCNMALMDIAAIAPLLQALHRALRPRGRFVFSVPHPCFNTNGTTMLAEREDYPGDVSVSFAIKVRQYRTLQPVQAVGIVGQPRPHYHFHRPLSTLLAACFAAGFAVDGWEEPCLEHEPEERPSLRWGNVPEIPPILVARCRSTANR
jgi:SAM-dependent methyltransferase